MHPHLSPFPPPPPPQGLSYLHESHIIHRDIKPSNLLLFSRTAGGDGDADNTDADGSSNDRTPMRLKIGDFGLSRVAGSDAAPGSGEAAGTLRYMCASAVQGQASYAEDVYGLGCTVLEMATREQPWQGADPAFIRERVLAGDAPPQLPAMLRGSGSSARASGVQQQRQRGLLAAFAARCVDAGLRRGTQQQQQQQQQQPPVLPHTQLRHILDTDELFSAGSLAAAPQQNEGVEVSAAADAGGGGQDELMGSGDVEELSLEGFDEDDDEDDDDDDDATNNGLAAPSPPPSPGGTRSALFPRASSSHADPAVPPPPQQPPPASSTAPPARQPLHRQPPHHRRLWLAPLFAASSSSSPSGAGSPVVEWAAVVQSYTALLSAVRAESPQRYGAVCVVLQKRLLDVVEVVRYAGCREGMGSSGASAASAAGLSRVDYERLLRYFTSDFNMLRELGDLNEKRCFKLGYTTPDAEALLHGEPRGSFLIRPSSRLPGTLVISSRIRNPQSGGTMIGHFIVSVGTAEAAAGGGGAAATSLSLGEMAKAFPAQPAVAARTLRSLVSSLRCNLPLDFAKGRGTEVVTTAQPGGQIYFGQAS